MYFWTGIYINWKYIRKLLANKEDRWMRTQVKCLWEETCDQEVVGISTWRVGVECKHADHQTNTSAI